MNKLATHPRSHRFKENTQAAMANPTLQTALGKLKTGFSERRAQAVARLPEFDRLRDEATAIKNHSLNNLDFYLERYEEKAVAAGAKVHWCRDAAEARETILRLCQNLQAKTVTKGKSMITEEIGLNDFLQSHGVLPIETDLGEYILQLRDEAPSHIVAPAIHVTKQEVADLFLAAHQELPKDRRLDEARTLIGEARTVLRQQFQTADVGITGANFLIAETGSSVIVTNEGNGDLTQTLAKAHIVVASIEKVVPTLNDAAILLRVLARSASGQEFSSYTTFSTGPRRGGDLDGPSEYHVVLLDNGRSAMLGTEFQDMLRCIRCGACMNHCPVYGTVGGHAYGWIYPGPMGAVLSPSLIGIKEAGHLPNASTFCGRCEQVCPVRIPLPKMMRHWRRREFEQHLAPVTMRWGLGLWSFVAQRPRLYHRLTQIFVALLRRLDRGRGRFRALPFASAWTKGRDMPAPEGSTFQAQWAQRQKVPQP